jgi:hypothetical protein
MEVKMGKTDKREMTLGEFIAEMARGWGFARPYHPQLIAKDLDEIIPQEDRGTVVQVEFNHWLEGWGHDSHYNYWWEVWGYIPDIKEKALFHKIKILNNGFIVGYTK